MTDYDKRVNDEADEHAQMMNKKHERQDSKKQPKVYVARTRMVWDRDAFTVTDKDVQK